MYVTQSPRNPLLTPLLVVSAFAAAVVLLAGAVFVTVLLRREVKSTPTAGCVVGSWTAVITKMRVNEQLNGYTIAGEYTSRGMRIRLEPDGTGVTDYGSGVTFSAPGAPAQTFVGSVRYDYQADGDRLTFANVVSDVTVTMNLPYLGVYTVRTEPIVEPADYSCGVDTLSLSNRHYSQELRS